MIKKIKDILPPTPIHLVKLRAVNKSYGELSKLVNLEPFEKSIDVVKSTYHGGNFQSNEYGKDIKQSKKTGKPC